MHARIYSLACLHTLSVTHVLFHVQFLNKYSFFFFRSLASQATTLTGMPQLTDRSSGRSSKQSVAMPSKKATPFKLAGSKYEDMEPSPGALMDLQKSFTNKEEVLQLADKLGLDRRFIDRMSSDEKRFSLSFGGEILKQWTHVKGKDAKCGVLHTALLDAGMKRAADDFEEYIEKNM